jgi:tRNA(adenine34) deaminase
MRCALKEARIAFSESEVPVGAVLVKDGHIVSSAHNLCRAQNDPTAHAELLAMKEAYWKLGSLDGCVLYVTLEPCSMCAGAMIHMRLPRLVFGAFDPENGCCGSKIDLSDHWFDYSFPCIGGVLESECAQILKDFFLSLRCE